MTDSRAPLWLALGASGLSVLACFCFRGHVRVDTPNGRRRIDSLKPGDEVYAFDTVRREVAVRVVSRIAQRPRTRVGRVESDRGQERLQRVRELMPVAEELGVSLSRLAIAWCLLNPRVSTVILGASRIEQLEENLGALDVVPLLWDEGVQARLAAVHPPGP